MITQVRMKTLALGAVMMMIASTVYSDRFDFVHVRSWDMMENPDDFPEKTDPQLKIEGLEGNPRFGISFSGGGTRAATAALGQLRALDELGWIREAQYITANSGGAWTIVPYFYLPQDISDRAFLGEHVPPEEIRESTLSRRIPKGSMAHAITNARIVDFRRLERLASTRHGDETYADLVGKIFLKPFGLHDRKKFFTLDNRIRSLILEDNPELRPDDFFIKHHNRPFLIVAGTLFARQRASDLDERFFFEMTPLYVGMRQSATVQGDDEDPGDVRDLGGGYVEPFGYDSYEPEGPPQNGRFRVRLEGDVLRGDPPTNKRYRFTLSDLLGTSSAAPLVAKMDRGLPNGPFPDFRHWPVHRTTSDESRAEEIPHGDGGGSDNLAVLPLLARGVRNILAFINSRHAFEAPENRSCSAAITEDEMVDDLVSFFVPTRKLKHNVVFEGGQDRLQEICETFEEQRAAGQPLVHCQSYTIQEGNEEGIRSYKPNICWVYLDRVGGWVEAIPDDRLKRQFQEEKDRLNLENRLSRFDRFPHFRTFGEQGAVIDLDKERVRALSSLTAWAVFESAKDIAKGLRDAGLRPSR